MKNTLLLIVWILSVFVAACTTYQETHAVSERQLQIELETLKESSPNVPGFAVAVIENGELISSAIGVADPTGQAMTTDTPVRIASITKTFVAAAILRLSEEGRLDLDAPIGDFISIEHKVLLQSDGYDTQAITIRHLLMHASGMNDHAGTEAFQIAAFSDPSHGWTRTEQIRVLIDETEKLSEPGAAYHYSDTGYILLGEAIERLTDKPLGEAVLELNRLNDLRLESVRWEGELDVVPDSQDRAHQYLDGMDTYYVDGSIDAFGGGGIIASVEDVARYYDALFSGQVFATSETLREMMVAPGHPTESPYRLGLFARSLGDYQVYGHGGFWGTDVMIIPALRRVVSGVSLDQGGTAALRSRHNAIMLADDF
ncbi:serine hydrolase domain-containing protein [Hyphomonas sp. FCG-A18]|uniref:serine hydrolase domain-containing protein n=1 Tax=Hyphomonas sp. FCG-A18 TaxID=3080019 RepID=UPI002B29C110|nr:serine hydrolase domain-containing protein [Hyphomonas sp. FCG-A18]